VFPAALITGGDSLAARQAVLQKLDGGELGALIATSILDQGLNMPFVRAIINAGGGPSVIRVGQRFGRGLRRKQKYNRLLFVDFWDDFDRTAKRNSGARAQYLANEGSPPHFLKIDVRQSAPSGTAGQPFKPWFFEAF